ncbi:monovalent cation:H+ antiporter, CPA1 family [Trujillonella endophytica]|uniref:Monovalent cation:H+ antiporter, CPA1 family n=1 Tax=Trujillonella endophytica TaxID=673521 RepID=A0A1H8VCR5_9ACTN|nr:monovalent cation:H+ antiporter, CPA1 family [Trujillella endophytica]
MVLVGVLVFVGGVLGPRLRVPAPLVQLALGVVVGFVPGLGDVELPPEVVLFLFLPALLYWESLNTSLREARANMRVITLQAVGLVLVTTATVAVAAHWLGLSWPMAWVLGAVLAPTDATAVAAVAGRLPRRVSTMLRAESLINDGTALALYAVAVGIAVGELEIGPGGVALRLLFSYAGGIAVGLAVAGLVVLVRRRLHDVRLENVLGVLTPFLAYLPAEQLHASGVVSVVVCGLALTQVPATLIRAHTRVQSRAFWGLTSYLLNGSLFVLVGLQLHVVVDGRTGAELLSGTRAALLVALVVILTRLAWGNTTPYVIRALDRRPAQRLRRVGFRQRQPLAWAGFRGAVSLAAALAIPATDAEGEPLAGRDLVLLVTFGVIVVTLVVQGLSLPAVVRWARLPDDPGEGQEHRLAQQEAALAALAALETRAAELRVPDTVVARLRADFDDRLHSLEVAGHLLDGAEEDGDRDAVEAAATERRLRLALLQDKRRAVSRLRREHRIDDLVLVRIQSQLDAEEVRLSGVVEED